MRQVSYFTLDFDLKLTYIKSIRRLRVRKKEAAKDWLFLIISWIWVAVAMKHNMKCQKIKNNSKLDNIIILCK